MAKLWSTACAAAAASWTRGRGLLSGLRLRGGHGVGLRCWALSTAWWPRPGASWTEDGLPADAAAAEALCGAPAGAGGAAPPGRHAGLPRGRDEAVAGQPGAAHGGGAPQTTEVERGARPYKPLPGGQLPQVRARGQRAKAGLAGGGGDHAAGHGALGGPGLCGAERRREVPAAERLPAVAGRAGLLGRAAISAPLEHSQVIRDLAGGHRHELTENMRSDPNIFNFVKWLRVGEEACPTLEQAKARRAAAGHPAEPRSYLRQLPGPHRPQPRPGVLPPHAAPPVRGRLTGHELRAAGSGLERAARRLQGLQHEVAHLEEHGHQPHVPGLHKRAAPAARELRGARHAVAGRVPEEAALQVHLALHVLALGAHLDGALQLALKLGAGGPRKGLLAALQRSCRAVRGDCVRGHGGACSVGKPAMKLWRR